MILAAATRFISKPALRVVRGLAICCSVLAMAQAQKPDAVETLPVDVIRVPSAAKEILKVASEVNGLDSGASRPWHIKLSYDEFDSDGDNVHSGTFEEFHVSPKKYKQIHTGDTLNQTDIAADSGLYRIGDQRWPGLAEYQARNAVLRPFYAFRADKPQLRIDKTATMFSTGKLPCVVLNSTGPLILLSAPTACFQPETVMLRYLRANLAEEVSYSSIVQFQGHYVAKEIAITRAGKPVLKIHVDELEEITKVGDAFFTPPAGATPLAGRITMPSALFMDEYAVSAPSPDYPRGSSGKVTVKLVVGKDGRVVEASAEDGPENLRKEVLKAVRKYQFRPYLILDQPVEVEFTCSFEYHSR